MREKSSCKGYLKRIQEAGEEFALAVEYRLTIPQMIAEAKFTHVDPNIRLKRLSINPELIGKSRSYQAKLVDFARCQQSGEGVYELKRNGFEPGNISQLLALAINHPDIARNTPIISLGTVFRDSSGNNYSPFIVHNGRRFQLGAFWHGSGCYSVCRFLAVKKS